MAKANVYSKTMVVTPGGDGAQPRSKAYIVTITRSGGSWDVAVDPDPDRHGRGPEDRTSLRFTYTPRDEWWESAIIEVARDELAKHHGEIVAVVTDALWKPVG